MNLKKLIDCVYDRRCIWDQKDPYYNTVVLEEKWDEIAKEMICSAEVCRQKWRNLRDVFRRELRKYHARLENPYISNKRQPQWHYFKELQFLAEQMAGIENNTVLEFTTDRPDEPFESLYVKNSAGSDPASVKNESESPQPEEVILEDSSDNFFAEIEDDNPEEDQEVDRRVTSVLNGPPLGVPVGSHSCAILRDGRKRVKRTYETSKEDVSDYHFLMSLLPYLRAIPYERKMLVRTKLQNIFCEEFGEK